MAALQFAALCWLRFWACYVGDVGGGECAHNTLLMWTLWAVCCYLLSWDFCLFCVWLGLQEAPPVTPTRPTSTDVMNSRCAFAAVSSTKKENGRWGLGLSSKRRQVER